MRRRWREQFETLGVVGSELCGKQRVRTARRERQERRSGEDHHDDGQQDRNEANTPPWPVCPGLPNAASFWRASASHRPRSPGGNGSASSRADAGAAGVVRPARPPPVDGRWRMPPDDARLRPAPLVEQVVDIGSERLTDAATLAHAVALVFRSRSNSIRRPREMRDITVPIGTSSMRAISAYENSSTSRNQTA